MCTKINRLQATLVIAYYQFGIRYPCSLRNFTAFGALTDRQTSLFLVGQYLFSMYLITARLAILHCPTTPLCQQLQQTYFLNKTAYCVKNVGLYSSMLLFKINNKSVYVIKSIYPLYGLGQFCLELNIAGELLFASISSWEVLLQRPIQTGV